MSAMTQSPREAFAAAREAFARADKARNQALDALYAAEPADLSAARLEYHTAGREHSEAWEAWNRCLLCRPLEGDWSQFVRRCDPAKHKAASEALQKATARCLEASARLDALEAKYEGRV